MKTKQLSFITALALCASALSTTHAAVVFVRTNGNDALPGTSWADAKRTFAAAIGAAVAGDEIWVARGTYAGHVTLKPDVALYGGFTGTEAARDERNWSTNLSVLWGTTNRAVVNITNAGPDTRLDGFTIGGGNAIHGGGIAMVGSGPVIANNTIRNNITDGAGAGVSIWGFHILSSTNYHFPTITNNVIVENQSINDEGDGGGIAVIGSSPVIAWNVIARNTATRNGGGIACWRHSFPVIANNLIEANSASYDELTASVGGGGIFASATDLDGRPIQFAISAPVIINNVIAANGGRHGGGISVVDSRLGAATIANNTIVANNGAGIYWANTWPTNDNNIVAFNTRGFERGLAGTSDAEIRFNDVYGNAVLGAPANYCSTADRSGTAGNFSADPAFANSAIGEFHLQPVSPCVNAGSTALSPTNWADIDRQARVQGGAVDIGADESDGATWNVPTPIVRVSSAGDDTDGSTWAKAKKTVADGIAAASSTGGEVWVAQGTYTGHILPPAFVYLYGGFAGGETNRAQRNPSAHPSVLDGGGIAPVIYYRNAGYRISALDGFTVQGGGIYTGGNPFHTDLTNRFGGRGGGVYCRVSGPVIANNLIRSNSLGSPFNSFESFGGGLYCYLSHAEITGNTFAENEVLKQMTGNGGGAYCRESLADITGNIFRQNHARDGAAIYGNYSELRVARNIVQSNALYNISPLPTYMGSGDGALTFLFAPDLLLEANVIQGNVAVFGAGVCLRSCFAARVQNNVIVDNLAYDFSGFGSGGEGGGLLCDVGVNATGSVVIANNTLVGNNAPPTFLGHFGGGMALTLYTNGLVVANNIIVSNSSGIWRYPYLSYQPVLQNNCVNNSNANNYINLSAGAGSIQADPQFVNRMAGDFHLLCGSPCIDAGTNANAPKMDLDGLARPLDGNTNGTAAFDIGAFEFAHPLADTDGDGLCDAAEQVAGTDATDRASTLRLTLHLLPLENCAALRWDSVTGRTYSVEFQPVLGPTCVWQTATGNLPGCGTTMEWRDPAGGPAQRFYRLGVVKD
jgi:Right handed beta helix region/Disaggregatase related